MKEFELEPGEEVILEVRKHWFLFLAELLPYAIMAVECTPFFGPLARRLNALYQWRADAQTVVVPS